MSERPPCCRFIIDAEGQRLGRLASLAAKYVRGKHTPAYTPSMDMGAFVIVINADKVWLPSPVMPRDAPSAAAGGVLIGSSRADAALRSLVCGGRPKRMWYGCMCV